MTIAQDQCVLHDRRWIGDGQCQLVWIREVEGVGSDVERADSKKCWRNQGFFDVEHHVNAFVVISRVVSDGHSILAMAFPYERLDRLPVNMRSFSLMCQRSPHLTITWNGFGLLRMDSDSTAMPSLCQSAVLSLGSSLVPRRPKISG